MGSHKRIIQHFIISGLFLTLGFASFFLYFSRKIQNLEIAEFSEKIESTFHKSIDNQKQTLLTLAGILAQQEITKLLLYEKSAQKILKEFQDEYEFAKKSMNLTNMMFLAKDSQVIFRFHDPTKNQDFKIGMAINDARKSKTYGVSIEPDASGALVLNVIVPVLDRDQIVGYLGLGTHLHIILNAAYSNPETIGTTFLVNKANLDVSALQNDDSISAKYQLLFFSNIKEKDSELKKVIADVDQDRAILNQPFQSGDNSFIVIPISQFGVDFGYLIVSGVLRPEMMAETKNLFIAGILAFFVLGYLYFAVFNAVQAILKSNEAMVQNAKMSAIGQIASEVAHEINGPLCVTSLHLEKIKILLHQPESHQRIIESVEKLDKMTKRIASIVAGIRRISRGGQSEQMSRNNLLEIVQEVTEISKSRFTNESILLQVQLDSTLNVFCQSHQFSQVILNLVNNAFDAAKMTAEKWVRIEAQVLSDKILIHIIDSGLGIPKETVKKMMEPFFTTKLNDQGTGLGLTISKKIMEAHHGKIFYNQSYKNTCITIELPNEIAAAGFQDIAA